MPDFRRTPGGWGGGNSPSPPRPPSNSIDQTSNSIDPTSSPIAINRPYTKHHAKHPMRTYHQQDASNQQRVGWRRVQRAAQAIWMHNAAWGTAGTPTDADYCADEAAAPNCAWRRVIRASATLSTNVTSSSPWLAADWTLCHSSCTQHAHHLCTQYAPIHTALLHFPTLRENFSSMFN